VILLDTSVLVNYFKGVDTAGARVLEGLVVATADIAISPYTYQELLQGARDELEFVRLRRTLITQEFLWLPSGKETFEKTARLYFDLRRKGVTVRGSIDLLIACTAIEHDVPLLHEDRDFDQISRHTALECYPLPE
jgi:predicted nucleic acid-binding protein